MVSLNMEKIQNDPTEQVLNLTLEIILLLTGEEYFVVKKPRDRSTNKSLQVVEETWKTQTGVHIPLPQFVIHEPNNKQKILHLTNKMIELLTGEVPLRYEDITVSFSMEEWKYIEEHKDLYKDVLMDDHQPLTSPGLPTCSSSEDPPVRNKEIRNEENVTNADIYTPTDHIQENPPIKKEPVSSDGRNLTEPTQQYPFIHIKEEPDSCDCEVLTEPNNYAGQYPCTSIKEERRSCDGENFKDQKNTPLDHTRQYPPSHLKNDQDGETVEVPVYVIEDYTQHCPSPPVNEEPFPCSGGNLLDNTQSLSTPSEEGLPDTNPPETHSRTNVQFSCSECKKCFLSMAELVSHQGIHIAEKLLQSRTHIVTTTIVHVPQVAPVKHKLLTCSTCGRTFYTKSSLVGHMKTHWGKVSETFQCILCGRSFSTKSLLNLHSKRHFGNRPFPCSTCGERFMRTSDLGRHQIKHR